jgi:hypothetical protein
LKRTKIEPFIIPQEKLDELKAILEDPKLGDYQKNTMMRKIGACLVCGQIATKIIKYRMLGITKIEKYCDEHVSTAEK